MCVCLYVYFDRLSAYVMLSMYVAFLYEFVVCVCVCYVLVYVTLWYVFKYVVYVCRRRLNVCMSVMWVMHVCYAPYSMRVACMLCMRARIVFLDFVMCVCSICVQFMYVCMLCIQVVYVFYV